MRTEDEPFALKSTEECQRRRLLLTQKHIKPLCDYLDVIKTQHGPTHQIPCFDPCDGGIDAKALFLLEAPGPKAIGSGYVSRNNPDQTAKNLCALMQHAHIERRDTVLWNIVPWYVGNGHQIWPVSAQDREAALPHLQDLLALLPNLQAIVLLGRKAQWAEAHLQKLADIPIVKTYHPSPQVFNRSPEMRQKVVDDFLCIAQRLVREDETDKSLQTKSTK